MSQSNGTLLVRPGLEGRATSMVTAFLIAMLVPLTFNWGDVLLSPLRLFLIFVSMPLMTIAFRAGLRLQVTDIVVLAYCLWAPLLLLLHHGTERLSFAVLTALETAIPYLIGRLLIRDHSSYLRMLKCLGVAICVLTGLAATEAIWQVQPLRPITEWLGDTYPWPLEERLGLWRAQTVFEHPILFGCFAAVSAILLFTAGMKRFALVAGIAVFFSLSAGAWLVLAIAMGLILWRRVWGPGPIHWWVLGLGTIGGYLVLEALSDRSIPEVLANWLSFSPHNAHWRLLTFRFVTENIIANPWIGIGMNDWARPEWFVTDSVDNFWLLQGLRYGMPGAMLMGLAVVSRFWGVVSARPAEKQVAHCRLGVGAALVALSVGICTVHIWGVMFAFFSFFLGASAFLTQSEPS
ncbi:hypothetical protein [Actibacterium pelagium]|uniref:O-antigen ligase n=1 Tax=Actibacterium pelagium TaxID=2029103 RepID=A0A917AJQ1_9RHOB|nr:hypothetical protein [Actibacterium pelagium]GGE56952.1 hypothetical protein GCM10011517_25910 [Actibacterium pelagium]